MAGALWSKNLGGKCCVGATLELERHLEKQQESQAGSRVHQKGPDAFKELHLHLVSSRSCYSHQEGSTAAALWLKRCRAAINEKEQRAALLNQWGCFLFRGFCVCPELWERLCKLTRAQAALSSISGSQDSLSQKMVAIKKLLNSGFRGTHSSNFHQAQKALQKGIPKSVFLWEEFNYLSIAKLKLLIFHCRLTVSFILWH